MANGIDVRLTAPQTRTLISSKTPIEDAHALLDRAERAGMDVTPHREHLNTWEARRVGMIREFAPKPIRSE